MFRPSYTLQNLLGLAAIIMSFGVSGSLLMGAVVNFNVAGANISINRKLQKAEEVIEKAENTVEQLETEPSVSPLKVKGLKAELREAKSIANRTEKEIEEYLEEP